MANTFLFAQGVDIGGSLAERDMADTAREIMDEAKTLVRSMLASRAARAASLSPRRLACH